MKSVQQVLFALARSGLAGWIVGWLFAHMSFAIPVNRLRETDTLIAFHHPKPSHPVHILLVPKRNRPDLMALETADTDFLTDLYRTAQELVREFGLEDAGYRLIVNGGAYQDVPQLHFHLISGERNDA